MTSPTKLTREQAIAQVVSELEGPTPLEVVVDRVLERKPSLARDTRSPIRGDIRLWASFLGIVFADQQRKIVVPVGIAMRGVRFRHVVADDEVRQRTFLLDESDAVYIPSAYPSLDLTRSGPQLVNAEGRTVAGQWITVKAPSHLDYGPQYLQVGGYKMPDFFRSHKVQAGDSLLFTIEQFDPPRWRLEHEPQAQRHQQVIAERNRELVDSLYQMLEAAPAEYLHDERAAVRSALIQTADPAGYPGDPWPQALAADGRMAVDIQGIVYAGSTRPSMDPMDDVFAAVLFDEADEAALLQMEDLPPLTEGAAERIYTFKVSSLARPQLWRRIEALGAEMLAELNSFLVKLFKHDDDHMGGFWKVVPRGKGRRTREVELATVNPLGGGPGGEKRLAELDLAEGDVLKWVFDFGEWKEYKLQLETIADPAAPPAAVEYPRVVAANKPALLYCRSCRQRGKQTVAQWCCWDCSNEQDETVMLCEECSRLPEHEEHYLEEWVY